MMPHPRRLSVALLRLSSLLCISICSAYAQTPQGTHSTTTTLTSTGVQGGYTLSATVIGNGGPNPTGNVVFTDVTTGTTLGTVALGTTSTPGGFGNAQTLSSQYNPDGAVFADVNGDGIPDLIVALANPYASAPPGAPANNNPNCGFCPGTQNIQVYLGNGDGTFRSPAYYPAGFNPNHIVIADLNGDGYPDMIVTDYDEVFGGTETAGGAYPTNEGYWEMGVYLNMGKSAPGTFAPAVYYKTGTNPWTAVVGDFNGDGFMDIIVDNSTDDTLQLFPGNGTGTFNAASSIVATGVAFENNHSLATADINADGVLDLIGVNFMTGNVQVLLGQGANGKGNGTFAAPMNFPASTGVLATIAPVGVAVADLNGDGKLDIVTSNRGATTATSSVPGSMGVLLGNGDGTFQSAVSYPLGDSTGGSYANGITVADMNHDGKADVVVVDNGTTNDVGIFYGNGDGTFQARVGVSVGPGGGTPLIADLNGDGRLDIGTENFNPNTTTTLLGFASQTAEISGITLTGMTADNVTAFYSGDTTYLTSTSNTLNLKAGGLLEPTLTVPAAAAAGTPFAVTVTEKNRDGTDATTYNGTLTFTSSDSLAVLPAPSQLVNGAGVFTITLYSDGPQTIAVSDTVNALDATSSNIAVSGGGATIAAANGSSSVTATFGDTATFNLTVTPLLSLFNQPVSFSLSGLPSNSYSYTFSPTTIAAGTSGPQAIKLKLQVPGTSARLRRGPLAKEHPYGVLFAMLIPLLGVTRLRRGRRLRRGLSLTLLLFAGIGAAVGLGGCNNSANPYQAPQVYPLVVTATSGGMTTTTTLTLTLTFPKS